MRSDPLGTSESTSSRLAFHAGASLLKWHKSSRELHEAHSTVPLPIREYIREVQDHLEFLTAYEGPELPLPDKLIFLRETRHAFGRTALVLSGGGALGAFHVVRTQVLHPHSFFVRM